LQIIRILEYLNLYKFKLNQNQTKILFNKYSNPFQGISPNIQIIIEDNYTRDFIYNYINITPYGSNTYHFEKQTINLEPIIVPDESTIIITKGEIHTPERDTTYFINYSSELFYSNNTLDETLKDFQNIIENGNVTKNVDNGTDYSYKNENSIFTITSTANQKNNEYINVTRIDLGECENKLKDEYNIPRNKDLYILKLILY
jgi:hypothetical protein